MPPARTYQCSAISQFVYQKGKGNVEPNRIGSVNYVRGVLQGVVLVEGMRTAMLRFGNRSLTGDEVRWGLGNMEIGPERLRQLGIEGLMPPLKVTCADHEGGGGIRFQQWSGERWVMISDWVQSDPSIVRPMVEASAAQYDLRLSTRCHLLPEAARRARRLNVTFDGILEAVVRQSWSQ